MKAKGLSMADTDNDSRAIWFLAGAAIGATVALLFAPQSGEETRRIIKDQANRGKDRLSESGRDLADRSRELYDKGRRIADEAAELFDRGKRMAQS
ncbi:MAG: YtxH domain-containing protein [Bryobacteraceae bacterium]